MHPFVYAAATVVTAALAFAGCTQATAPAPTAAPTKAVAEPAKASAPVTAAQPTATAPAQKIDFPQKGKTITIIVPYPPGNAADLASRRLAEKMKSELGTNVEVENHAGAGSQVGMTDLAKAKPDGYTLGTGILPDANLIYLDAERAAAFTRKSFEPLAAFTQNESGFAVKGDSPFKTMKDAVDAAKANPRKVRVSTNGYMTGTHLIGVALSRSTGAQFALAHYEGMGQNVAGLMGGHTDVAIVGAGGAVDLINKGEIRMLGTTGSTVCKFLSGVKTVKDQGYDIVYYATRGWVVPAGTPRGVVDILAGVIKKLTEDAQFIKAMEDIYQEVRYVGPAEYATIWDKEDDSTRSMLTEIKATK